MKNNLILLTVTFLLAACTNTQDTAKHHASSVTTLIDRTHRIHEWAYLETDGKLYIRRSEFPGYLHQQYWRIDGGSLHIVKDLDSTVEPPFVPPGPAITLRSGSEQTYHQPSAGNAAILAILQQLSVEAKKMAASDIPKSFIPAADMTAQTRQED